MMIQNLCFVLFLVVPFASAQLNIQVSIAGGAQPTIDANSLSNAVSTQGLAGKFQGTITQSSDTILVVDKCSVGTYSSYTKIATQSSVCVNCTAGTASNVEGASTPMTCAACNAGSFSGSGAANCTDCPKNTFSTTYMATRLNDCLACPPHSTSPAHSDHVEACVCDDGYFQSNNILTAFDAVLASLAFIGMVSIDIPHLVC